MRDRKVASSKARAPYHGPRNRGRRHSYGTSRRFETRSCRFEPDFSAKPALRSPPRRKSHQHAGGSVMRNQEGVTPEDFGKRDRNDNYLLSSDREDGYTQEYARAGDDRRLDMFADSDQDRVRPEVSRTRERNDNYRLSTDGEDVFSRKYARASDDRRMGVLSGSEPYGPSVISPGGLAEPQVYYKNVYETRELNPVGTAKRVIYYNRYPEQGGMNLASDRKMYSASDSVPGGLTLPAVQETFYERDSVQDGLTPPALRETYYKKDSELDCSTPAVTPERYFKRDSGPEGLTLAVMPERYYKRDYGPAGLTPTALQEEYYQRDSEPGLIPAAKPEIYLERSKDHYLPQPIHRSSGELIWRQPNLSGSDQEKWSTPQRTRGCDNRTGNGHRSDMPYAKSATLKFQWDTLVAAELMKEKTSMAYSMSPQAQGGGERDKLLYNKRESCSLEDPYSGSLLVVADTRRIVNDPSNTNRYYPEDVDKIDINHNGYLEAHRTEPINQNPTGTSNGRFLEGVDRGKHTFEAGKSEVNAVPIELSHRNLHLYTKMEPGGCSSKVDGTDNSLRCQNGESMEMNCCRYHERQYQEQQHLDSKAYKGKTEEGPIIKRIPEEEKVAYVPGKNLEMAEDNDLNFHSRMCHLNHSRGMDLGDLQFKKSSYENGYPVSLENGSPQQYDKMGQVNARRMTQNKIGKVPKNWVASNEVCDTRHGVQCIPMLGGDTRFHFDSRTSYLDHRREVDLNSEKLQLRANYAFEENGDPAPVNGLAIQEKIVQSGRIIDLRRVTGNQEDKLFRNGDVDNESYDSGNGNRYRHELGEQGAGTQFKTSNYNHSMRVGVSSETLQLGEKYSLKEDGDQHEKTVQTNHFLCPTMIDQDHKDQSDNDWYDTNEMIDSSHEYQQLTYDDCKHLSIAKNSEYTKFQEMRNIKSDEQLGSLKSRVSVKERLGTPIETSRRNVKDRLGPGNKVPPWIKNLVQKSETFGLNLEDLNGDLHVERGGSSESKETRKKSDSDKISEEFKHQAHSAFLKYYKFLNENAPQRKKYMELGIHGGLKCLVCGSKSKTFVSTRSLATHACMTSLAGSRVDHIGFHRALCVLMGWNYEEAPKSPWALQMMTDAEIHALKEDLIIWPPVVVVRNISIAIYRPDKRKIISIEEFGAFLRDNKFDQAYAKVRWGRPANESVMVVNFQGTYTGLQEAERLHNLYAETKHGRTEFNQISNSNESQVDNAESNLYGYLGLASDLDKLDTETKKRSVLRSKNEIIKAIAASL